MAFCIPKDASQKLLEAAKRGEINVAKLFEMDSAGRRSFFEGYTTKENAEGINAGFERAIASKQKEALGNWVNSVYNPTQQKKGQAKDIVDRINDLKEADLIGEGAEGFYQDLIAAKLGVRVTETEMAELIKKSSELEKLYETKNKFGLPTIEYFKAKRDMQKYLYSLVPAPELRVATSTIARGTLLLSFKSPLTNVVGNSVQGLIQSFEKRLASGNFDGANPGLSREYVKYATDVYVKSGYDVTRMLSLTDDSKLIGEDIVHSEGKGAVRKVGRAYEDFVFKNMLGAPDVAFSAIAFSDSANLASTAIAKKMGLKGEELKAKAAEIFNEAASITPVSDDAKIVRAQAIADAQYATFTNNSTYTTFALGIRSLFNIATGNLRLGDQIMPFVKTPANVIGGGLDAAGLAAIRSTIELPAAITEMKDGNLDPMRGVIRGYVRSGLGMTLAFIISSLFDPDEFVGEYPTTEKERQLLELGNATPNSIKIGEKWISLDYFGPIGAPLVGMMYAKKYGNNIPNAIYKYGQGVGTQSLKIPGFNELYDTIETFKNNRPDTGKSAAENIGGVVTGLIDFIHARVVPSILYDVAKGTDKYERKTDKSKPFDRVYQKTPGLRQKLAVDKTVLGQDRETENFLSTMLFGSRVKTARTSNAIKELQRLDSTGNLPSITDVEKTSPRVKEFKTQVDEKKFRESMDNFSIEFGKRLEKEMASSRYNRLDDEKRADVINKIKSDTLDKVLRKSGYKKPRK